MTHFVARTASSNAVSSVIAKQRISYLKKRTVINDISAAIVKCRCLEFGTPPMLVGCRRVKFTWTSFNAD